MQFFPSREGPALLWMRRFAQEIAKCPADYFISPANSRLISAAVDSFQDAYDRCTKERTHGAIIVKNAARSEAERICRQFALFIKHHTKITAEQCLHLGVKPKTSRPAEPLSPAQPRPGQQLMFYA